MPQKYMLVETFFRKIVRVIEISIQAIEIMKYFFVRASSNRYQIACARRRAASCAAPCGVSRTQGQGMLPS